MADSHKVRTPINSQTPGDDRKLTIKDMPDAGPAHDRSGEVRVTIQEADGTECAAIVVLAGDIRAALAVQGD